MRAILIHVVLKHPPEYSQQELQALIGRLPQEARRVLHAEKTIGFLTPYIDPPSILEAKLRSALVAFESYTIMGLTGESVSKDGQWCPFEAWMDNNGRVQDTRKRGNSKHVPLTERRKIGSK